VFPPLRLREALTLGGLSVRELLHRTWNRLNDHEIMTRAAAVSFYAMLAMVPFLALVLTISVQLLPDVTGLSGRTTGIGNLTTEQLRATLKAFLPTEGYKVFEDQIGQLQGRDRPPLGLLAVSTAVTAWLASSLFVAIIDAMNRIYGVNETRSFLRIRLTAIAMTFLEAAILVGSLLAIVVWDVVARWLGLSQSVALLATVVLWSIVFLMVLLSFALSFYVGPDAEQKWEWITPGSLIGTAAFLAACVGFRVYVRNFGNYDKTYGSLGGVMVLLFWFWISSLVLLSAAQMNKVIEDASPLGRRYGQKSDPSEPPDLKAIAPETSRTI
jgi:membrane protein